MFTSIRDMKMKNNISYHWGGDHLLILLGNRTQKRLKVLFFAEFILTIGMATVFLTQAMHLKGNMVHWLTSFGVSLLYMFAAYRFFSRMFYREKLVVDTQALTIIQRTPFSQRSRSFEWSCVGPLHYVGKPRKTDHPLKGRSYDYMGFETHEHLIQSLHQEGNMYFNYCGFPVRFARGVYSWDAEEIVHMIKLYAGECVLLGPEWARMMEQPEWDI